MTNKNNAAIQPAQSTQSLQIPETNPFSNLFGGGGNAQEQPQYSNDYQQNKSPFNIGGYDILGILGNVGLNPSGAINDINGLFSGPNPPGFAGIPGYGEVGQIVNGGGTGGIFSGLPNGNKTPWAGVPEIFGGGGAATGGGPGGVFGVGGGGSLPNPTIGDDKLLGDINSIPDNILRDNLITAAAEQVTGIDSGLGQLQLDAALSNQADQAALGARNAVLAQSRALETQILLASFQEKVSNMYIQIADARISNIWSRLKQLAAGFKY